MRKTPAVNENRSQHGYAVCASAIMQTWHVPKGACVDRKSQSSCYAVSVQASLYMPCIAMTHRTGELTPFREEKRGNCKIGRFKIGRCKTYLSFFFVRLVPKVQDIKIKRYRFLTDKFG